MKNLFNPNFIYIISFMVPFLFYALEWSTLYPSLGSNLMMFYLFTFAVCLLFGLVVNGSNPFRYKSIAESKGNLFILALTYLLYAVEVIYSRTIPLFALIRDTFTYSEDSFGIPVIHTFLVSFNTFYAIYLFHQYMSNKKAGLLWLFFISVLPFILLVYRSSILSVLLGALVVYLLEKRRISLKVILRSVTGVLLVFFMFGYMGNLRSAQGDPTYIPRASGATDKFLNSSIPKEFYWSYLYVASPVANLQNNINAVKVPEGGYKDLVLNEFLPAFVTKFIASPAPRQFYQINPFLNVGTIYVYSFSFLRWQGILLLFFYFIALINVYYYIIQKSDTFKVTGMAILLNMIVFANFHNTIAYSAASIQLIYPIIFSMIQHYVNRKSQEDRLYS
jgi:hypothetical protein